jgi:hypothetical protein
MARKINKTKHYSKLKKILFFSLFFSFPSTFLKHVSPDVRIKKLEASLSLFLNQYISLDFFIDNTHAYSSVYIYSAIVSYISLLSTNLKVLQTDRHTHKHNDYSLFTLYVEIFLSFLWTIWLLGHENTQDDSPLTNKYIHIPHTSKWKFRMCEPHKVQIQLLTDNQVQQKIWLIK